MIPYNQTTSKITNTESFRLKSCVRRTADSIDKRFCFDIVPEDRPAVVYTLQVGALFYLCILYNIVQYNHVASAKCNLLSV